MQKTLFFIKKTSAFQFTVIIYNQPHKKKKMAKAIIYSDFEFNELEVQPPRQNKQKGSMSALSAHKPLIQLGSTDDPCCAFRQMVDGVYINIHLKTNDIRTFLSDVEDDIINIVFENSNDWFNKSLTQLDVRRMLCSLITPDWDIVVKRSRALRCFRHVGDENVENIEIQDVPKNSLVVPIVRFDGIFVARHHFSLSFTLDHMLVLGIDDIEDDAPEHPFILFENEDLEDPHMHSLAQDSVLETGSFETHCFRQDE